MSDLPPPPPPRSQDEPPRRRGWMVWLGLILFGLGGGTLAAFVTVTAAQYFTPSVKSSLIDYDLSPAGDMIVFTSASGGLYSYGLLTHTLVRISPTGAGGASPRFSGDGKHIVFAGPAEGR